MQIDLSEFVTFVKSYDGKVLHTRKQRTGFEVKVIKSGFEYTPSSTLVARPHGFTTIERVLEQFSKTGSFNTSQYKHITQNSSYTLTLIEKYLESINNIDDISEKLSKNEIWTDIEYRETVKAYLWMLEQEKNGKPYKKSEVNRLLRGGALSSRSKGSLEYRMQNISAVFQELCLPWVYGYKPAVNVGADGKEKIRQYAAMLGEYNPEDFSPTANTADLEQKVVKIRKRIVTVGIPTGEQKPQQIFVTTSAYVRDPLVKAWVLVNAGGICEACGSPAPFNTIYDEPFLEVHHVIQLADGGSDTITNAIALCPNCHRRCHLSIEKSIYVDSLYSKIQRLIRD